MPAGRNDELGRRPKPPANSPITTARHDDLGGYARPAACVSSMMFPDHHETEYIAAYENARCRFKSCPGHFDVGSLKTGGNYMLTGDLRTEQKTPIFLKLHGNFLATPTADGAFSAFLAGGRWDKLLVDFAAWAGLKGCKRYAKGIEKEAGKYLSQKNIIRLGEITTESIAGHLAAMKSAGKSAKTLLNVRGALSQFCEFLLERRLIQGNPALAVKLAAAEETAPAVVGGRKELAEILRAARSQGGCGGYGQVLADAILVAAHTGLRLSELCRMAWVNVHWEARYILMPKTKGKRPKTTPMSASTTRALHRQRRRTRGLAWVFPARKTWRGGGWRWLDKPCSANAMLERLGPVKAGFAIFNELPGKSVGRGWHLFRHTFATELAEAGVNLQKISSWMGHSDIRMTARYTHLRRRFDGDIECIMQKP